jgi:signal transduction histidine kinase
VSSLTIRISNSVGRHGWPDPVKVFTGHYKSGAAKKEVGVGLGLWLVKKIATKLGCESRCGADETLVHFYFSMGLN